VKVLSSQEELLMLAILALGKNAYGVTIRRHVSKVTGKEWSIGAIYDPLYRLEKNDYVRSFLSRPTRERGGRAKRIFQVTPEGKEALVIHKKVRDELWDGLTRLALGK
jgi:PadR family transcriptional regulator PadR